MTITGDMKRYLDDQGMPYETVIHHEAYTAGDEARAVGTVAAHVAKTLVVKARDGDVLAVIPASERIDMHKLHDLLGDSHARLATEDEMKSEFPDFELGAVPPLGELIGAPVIIDEKLQQADEVIFTGGTHTESVKMSTEDFLKLAHPQVADLTREPGAEMLY
ncbi:MAG: aminoacyl-tRNA deacylase [Thermoleophilia bacterium]|jgi:Ala-tRNA(Pro) deacylase|nr:YbaK/EbsC family protein [Actinomycetota bacterium]MCL6093825.1 YbaK/EbsC family protein [Actinomycetota bacterium]MDA8167761.1 YbaK/EbsC family protein [Actinomycetota bacterium]